MDLLSKRYANPCFFMDGMISTGQFSRFVVNVMNTHNEELNEEKAWQYYLFRVLDKSFNDFKEELKQNNENQNMPKQLIETTVQHSMNILQNFNPETRG